jgi:hypothetical protein
MLLGETLGLLEQIAKYAGTLSGVTRRVGAARSCPPGSLRIESLRFSFLIRKALMAGLERLEPTHSWDRVARLVLPLQPLQASKRQGFLRPIHRQLMRQLMGLDRQSRLVHTSIDSRWENANRWNSSQARWIFSY